MKYLLIINLFIPFFLECSEQETPDRLFPKSPPIAIPQAPWRDVNGSASSNLTVFLHLKDVEAIKKREHEEAVKQKRRALEEAESSGDESQPRLDDEEDEGETARMSSVTSPLEEDDKKDN